jgi:hypothetical protein
MVGAAFRLRLNIAQTRKTAYLLHKIHQKEMIRPVWGKRGKGARWGL